MIKLDDTALAKLAHELVRNIRNYQKVFSDYGITEADYLEISQNEYFKKVKEQYTIAWNASTSTEDRVRLESLSYYEQLMPSLTRRAMEPTEALPAATGVATLLMRTAGLSGNDTKPAGNLTERFLISINLGADVNGKTIIEKFDRSVEINANDTDPNNPSPRETLPDHTGQQQQTGPSTTTKNPT